MPLTIETIRTTEDNEALFDLLSVELQSLLPEAAQEDRDLYHETIASLPRGLRAMAGMHFFDVSMAMDDLAWHFGNQNDERDLRETLNGLRELELIEIAECFEKMWEFMKPYMATLQTGDYGKDFHDWLDETGAQAFADPMDKLIWNHCEKAGKLGLLESWPIYARKYPERCVVSETQA
jgi:hypothetical protein